MLPLRASVELGSIAMRRYSAFPKAPGRSRGIMVNALDCGIVVRESELQSCDYVHFWTNTIGKGMNPVILPFMG